MGLDFSHGEAYWGYSGFNRFRTKLAAEIGVALRCMEGFAWNDKENKSYEDVWIHGYNEQDSFMDKLTRTVGIQPVIKWEKVKDDIVPLLDHSDCEGILTPEECKKIAPRLRELVKDWEDGDRDKENALLLAEGMEIASEESENLEFR